MSSRFTGGWENIILGEHAEFRNGVNFTAKSTGKNVKVLGVSDFASRSIITDFGQMPSVTLANTPKADDYLRDGDFVFVRSNGSRDLIGRCAMVHPRDERVMFSGFTIRMRLVSSAILPRFWLYFAKSELFKKALHERGSGSYITNLSQETLSEIDVALPPIQQQKRIVVVLDAWDQAIDQTERLIAARRQCYRGLLQRLAGPAFIDEKSNSWAPNKLGNVFAERDERSADLPLLSITGGGGVVPRDELDRRQTASEDKSKYKVIRPDDIGFNTMRMWQGVFGRSKHTGIVSPAYTVVTAIDDRIDPVFASHLFAHPRAISLFHRYSQGLVDDTLMLKFPQFSEISMRLPDINEQRKLGEMLETEAAGLHPQDLLLESLRTQKRGLMQKLLTGEWLLGDNFK